MSRKVKKARHCRHCGAVKYYVLSRGLCSRCYHQPAVLALYPPDVRFQPKREMSQAELDALVAEQMKNLPPWWKDENPDGD